MDFLALAAHALEDDYFHHQLFDPSVWEKLARQFERLGRICRAEVMRRKACHIQDAEAALARGEQYPLLAVRMRYADWETYL